MVDFFSKDLEHGLRHQFLVQMSALISRVVEELSVFCHWEEDGTPVERYLDIVPLKNADAERHIFSTCKCIKDKNLQVGNIVGIGFDGAATFSGKRQMFKHAT